MQTPGVSFLITRVLVLMHFLWGFGNNLTSSKFTLVWTAEHTRRYLKIDSAEIVSDRCHVVHKKKKKKIAVCGGVRCTDKNIIQQYKLRSFSTTVKWKILNTFKTSNIIFQSKTVKVTYPWPSDTLVTLEDKQDKSTCQQLLALYNHVWEKKNATIEPMWQTGLNSNTSV